MQLSKTLSVLSFHLAARITKVPICIKPRIHLCHSPLLRQFCVSAAMSSAKGRKVYVTRRVPSGGINLLKEAGCQLIEWSSDEAVPQDELLKGVAGVDAIYCLLSDKIDKGVLDAAGEYLVVPDRLRFCTSATMSFAKGSKIYVTRLVASKGINLLREAGCQLIGWSSSKAVPRDEFLKGVAGVDAIHCLFTDKIDKEILDAAGEYLVVPGLGPQLKVIATLSVGFDHIDVEECHRRNILIGYTPGILTKATAELTVALLLATSRNIQNAINAVRNGEWGTWKPMWLCGPGLDGSTVGIVGMGRIGSAISEMLRPFGVSQFLYTSSRGPKETTVPAKHVDFPTLLKESDFVIVSCALTPETKGMFDASAFAQMKKNAIFVNTSRGAIVNQEDLIQALKNGTIRAAGLDVTTPEPLPLDSPLLQLKNCTVLPHIGSAAEETRANMSELTARNIITALNSEPMPSQLKP